VQEIAETDSVGQFSQSLDVDEAVEVVISVSKEGATSQQVRQVSPDAGPMDDLAFTLSIGGEESREPGRPTNILLQDQSTSSIRVQESGGTSIARLTFQVVDSTGNPIDIDQAVDVNFRFGKQPGGATLTPGTVQTNGEGQATVNVSSGKTAGVAQIVAQTERPDGTEFQSKPVSLTVHGGLPNKCHFSLAPAQFNFPGLTDFGVSNTVSVFVGDKYGNPVVPGTAVYFSTNAGLIGGSAQTDDQGRGSVSLTSAQPLPDDGVGTVRAETVGTDDVNTIVNPDNCPDPAESGNENTIFETIPVVFSGRPEVIVDPNSVEKDPPQSFDLTVRDVPNENPLAPGTTIQVEAEGTNVKAVGNNEVTLGDTALKDENGDGYGREDIQNQGDLTDFTFKVVKDVEGKDNPEEPVVEAITITVEGPNGSLETVLTSSPSGSSTSKNAPNTSPLNAMSPTEGATVQRTPTGKVVVRAPKDQ
jgi:hypothetical protein